MSSFDDSVENFGIVILRPPQGINVASDLLLTVRNRRILRPVRPRNDDVSELR